MSFQIKDFNSLVASKIAHMRAVQDKITDFSVGSVARTLVEAPAIELDEFYQRMLFGLLEAIPVAVFDAFDFQALPALAASGDVRFTLRTLRAEPMSIPAGTVIRVGADNRRYIVSVDSEIPAGEFSALVRVHAERAGEGGNATVGEVDTLVSYLPEPVTITNPLPIVGGHDEESTEDRKTRFISFIGSLSRGTVYACEYAVRSTVLMDASGVPIERITHVGIDESPGHAAIYVYSSGGLPSAAMIDKVQLALDGQRINGMATPGYRPIGVQLDVLPMTERHVDIPLRAALFSGVLPSQMVDNQLRDSMARAVSAVMPGGALFVESVSEAALMVRQIERVTVGLNSNILARVNEVLLLGDLSVTWETQ